MSISTAAAIESIRCWQNGLNDESFLKLRQLKRTISLDKDWLFSLLFKGRENLDTAMSAYVKLLIECEETPTYFALFGLPSFAYADADVERNDGNLRRSGLSPYITHLEVWPGSLDYDGLIKLSGMRLFRLRQHESLMTNPEEFITSEKDHSHWFNLEIGSQSLCKTYRQLDKGGLCLVPYEGHRSKELATFHRAGGIGILLKKLDPFVLDI